VSQILEGRRASELVARKEKGNTVPNSVTGFPRTQKKEKQERKKGNGVTGLSVL
jgi:hypothetical protein